jgi:hypothetical protein
MIDEAEKSYCLANRCTNLQREFFRRVKTVYSPSRSRGEHAIDGKTSTELFRDAISARLSRAACEGKVKTVKSLIDAGADPNVSGEEVVTEGGKGEVVTPLLWAIDCESIPGVKALLERGADPNRAGKYGNTAVTVASQAKEPAILSALLAHGGDPNSHTDEETALELAFIEAWYNEADGVPEAKAWANWNQLISAGADINKTAGRGDSLADVAADHRRFDKVDWLLEHGWRGDYVYLGRSLSTYLDLVEKRSIIPKFAAAQKPWVDRVQARLEREGVRFPVPALSLLRRDENGRYIQD